MQTMMTITSQDVRDAHIAFLKAEREWSLCLVECFGANACNIRYTKEGEGIHGSDLNNCYLDFAVARDYWQRIAEEYTRS